jgi:hypothetical protein
VVWQNIFAPIFRIEGKQESSMKTAIGKTARRKREDWAENEGTAGQPVTSHWLSLTETG